MQSLFLIAWRNVLRHYWRSSATILSITIGFLAIMLFEGYMSDLTELFNDVYPRRGMLGDLIVEKVGARTQLALDFPDRYQVNEDEQLLINSYLDLEKDKVETRVRFLPISGVVRMGRTQAIFAGLGNDLKSGELMRGPGWAWNTLTGQPLSDDTSDQMIMGRLLGRTLGCNSDPTPNYHDDHGYYKREIRPFSCPKKSAQLTVNTLNGQVNSLNSQISGFTDMAFRDVDNKFIGMSLDLAQSLLDTKNVAYFTLKLSKDVDQAEFASSFREAMSKQGLDLEVGSWKAHEFGKLYRQLVSFLEIFQNFLMAVVCFVALLSVGNTVAKNINERAREIGTLRSCGFLDWQVAVLFATESVFLAIVSMLTGLIVLGSLISTVNSLKITYLPGLMSEQVPFRLNFDVNFCLFVALSLSSATFLSAFFPAWRAAKKPIPELLTST